MWSWILAPSARDADFYGHGTYCHHMDFVGGAEMQNISRQETGN